MTPLPHRARVRLRTSAAALLALAASAALLAGGATVSRIFLPGTQPGTVDTVAAGGAAACASCHSGSAGADVPIQGEWAGSMMAHSARDPVFRAALAVTNRYAADAGENTGEYCLRCHSPAGWLAGRSEDVSGSSLRGTDLDGVQCVTCHRSADPLNPDSSVPPMVRPVPGYGNGMYAVQAASLPLRGPRDGVAAGHATAVDTFLSSSAFCGVCHDVSNPFHTEGDDRLRLAPHSYAPLERTYSEWLMSAFASEGREATCQGCHMTPAPAHAAPPPLGPHRQDVRVHDLTGGNTFVPRILAEFWPGLDTAALGRASERAGRTLRRAARLDAEASATAAGVELRVRITNLAGHKLPTGYPEGRRMWLTVIGAAGSGDTLFRSGVYDSASAILDRDSSTTVFEAVHGLSAAAAAKHGLTPGPSFHFSLNDSILLDNRIPPRGFTNAGFASRLAAPVGAAYGDGVHWADRVYLLPPGVSRVNVSLWYQTLSREYAEFLRDENRNNPFDPDDWGGRLYDAWERHGRSEPALVDSTSLDAAGGPTPVPPDGGRRAAGPGLDPAWPNPFNGSTRLRFRLREGGHAVVAVYDIAGRAAAVAAEGAFGPGEHTAVFRAEGLAGGVYVVVLRTGRFSESRKILLLR